MTLPTKQLSLKPPLVGWFRLPRAFRARATRGAVWRQASPEEQNWLKTQPELETLGDFLFLAPGIEDELWFLIERIWHGFPDPPKYAFLAYDLNGQLIVAKDVDRLPGAWILQEP